MRTRTNDFYNQAARRPEYSFQFYDAEKCQWTWVNNGKKEPARWLSEEHRDKARACFTYRKTQERAQLDLAAVLKAHPSL